MWDIVGENGNDGSDIYMGFRAKDGSFHQTT